MLTSFFWGSHKCRNYFGEGIYGWILFLRGATFFSSTAKTSFLLNYLNPLNFLVLFQNSQTLGGSHSPGRAQCHNQIHFQSSNCMMKTFIFSAVVWLWDRGSRGACLPSCHPPGLQHHQAHGTTPFLCNRVNHPFTHPRSDFQVSFSPKKPAQQLHPEMW